VKSWQANLKGAELKRFVRDAAMSCRHQTCTAKMGQDAMSVVDGTLKLYGIPNLRIADGSATPRVTTDNTWPPTSSSANPPQKSSSRSTQSDAGQEGISMALTGSDQHLTKCECGPNAGQSTGPRPRRNVSEFKVGLASEILNARHSPTALVRANYLTAVASRVDSFWVDDHLNSLTPRAIATPEYLGVAKLIPKVDASLEPWTMLGHLAARNRFGRLRLGVGVTDAGRRNPAVTAQAAATLHLLTRGRAILGIGPGEREGNQPYGVDWTKPVARFEEALATIRALWDSGGELVTRDSPYFPLHNAVFDLPPYRGSWPEIWIGAHGPRMLRATGRYADAWLPSFPHRPREYEQRLEVVRTAASDAGRDPMSITPAALLFVITGRTRDDAEEALNSDIAKSFALNISGEIWARHGLQHPLGEDFSGTQDLIPQTMDKQTVLSYTAQVPASLLKEAFLTGTPDDVIDLAAHWRDHGLRYAVVVNISTLQPSLRKGLAASIPVTAILRGLKRL
jgi:phthiodiolone/phenolphthiodiolone dimycocerosates ketoreductase